MSLPRFPQPGAGGGVDGPESTVETAGYKGGGHARADSRGSPAPADGDGDGDGHDDDEIELVIGITRAVGTPAVAFMEQLDNSLANYGYESTLIKISGLIEDDLRAQGDSSGLLRPDERFRKLIEHGNRLCEQSGRLDELALRAVDSIRQHREVAGLGIDDEDPSTPVRRRCYIVDSLKREDEVTSLRNIYGDHFLLVGLQAPAGVRRRALTAKFEASGTDPGTDARDQARDLMDVDDSEPSSYGQDVLRTFPLADVFVETGKSDKAVLGARRLVALLFGDPAASGPTRAEYGMQLATQTQSLSPELGLRVGAAVMSARGDVLAVGTNHHPIEAQIPDHDASAVGLRNLARDTLRRLSDAGLLNQDATKAVVKDPDGYVRELFGGALRDSEMRALTEYQRPVHAEMDALVSAIRQRADLSEATFFVTDFPCHNCAKHLIAVGAEVVYLAPYAKSKAVAMYGKKAAAFRPFTGVAPRRFEALFLRARTADRKDDRGERLEWDAQTKRLQSPKVTAQIGAASKHAREVFALSLNEQMFDTIDHGNEPGDQDGR